MKLKSNELALHAQWADVEVEVYSIYSDVYANSLAGNIGNEFTTDSAHTDCEANGLQNRIRESRLNEHRHFLKQFYPINGGALVVRIFSNVYVFHRRIRSW